MSGQKIQHTNEPTVEDRRHRRIARKLVAGVATGMVALGVLAAAPASAAMSYYGETPDFHCSTGAVVLDSVRLPTAEIPASYSGAVYIWYGGEWQFYTYAQLPGGARTAVISDGGQNENQVAMTASVPRGYYYRVWVTISSRTHSASGVWGEVDALSQAYYGGAYCSA